MDFLDRVIVLRPTRNEEEPSYLEVMFQTAGRSVPQALTDWEQRVDGWCAEYREASDPSRITEVSLQMSVYLFDLCAERVVLAYGISVSRVNNLNDETPTG